MINVYLDAAVAAFYKDEDREIEMSEFAADKVADILLDYGYHMLVMPSRRVGDPA